MEKQLNGGVQRLFRLRCLVFFGLLVGFGNISAQATVGNLQILHQTPAADGTLNKGVVQDGRGNVYGTATKAGQFGHGVVYKIAPDGTYL